MTIEQAISYVKPLDEASMKAAQKRFSDIAMPLGGLGILQEIIIRIAGVQRQPVPEIKPRAAVIFCADNVPDGEITGDGRLSGRYRCRRKC